MLRTVTGKIEIQSDAKINYLHKTSNYVFVSEGIFKLKVQDDKIVSLSMYVKPNMDKTYIKEGSEVVLDSKGNVDYDNSLLVQPWIGIQDNFYIWGENISVKPHPQGVFSLDAKARTGVEFAGYKLTVPVEKRKHITPDFLTTYLGCSEEALSKFILQLKDDKQQAVSTGEGFSSQKLTICGFGLESHKMRLKAKKCELKPEEELLLESKVNTAKNKLEANEASKKEAGVKSHRELAAE